MIPASQSLHRDWRDAAAGRLAMLADFDRQADNIKTCVHWLTGHGVSIVAVDLRRGRHQPHIEIAASPLLHSLFGDDCATVERRQDGNRIVYTWAAVRFGCALRWEESA